MNSLSVGFSYSLGTGTDSASGYGNHYQFHNPIAIYALEQKLKDAESRFYQDTAEYNLGKTDRGNSEKGEVFSLIHLILVP